MTLPDRFWTKVDKSDPDGCWLWTGSGSQGYGKFQLAGRPQSAHRLAWTDANGPIPEGAVLRHSCDRPSCVNPAHLTPGTRRENSRDMVERGRYRKGDPLMSLRYAAMILGVRPDTLRQQIHNGKLGATMLGGWHVRKSEVERYARDHRGKLGPK